MTRISHSATGIFRSLPQSWTNGHLPRHDPSLLKVSQYYFEFIPLAQPHLPLIAHIHRLSQRRPLVEHSQQHVGPEAAPRRRSPQHRAGRQDALCRCWAELDRSTGRCADVPVGQWGESSRLGSRAACRCTIADLQSDTLSIVGLQSDVGGSIKVSIKD